MANTFTDIVDVIFGKALLALRQYSVMPRIVNTDFSAEVAAQGDTINVTVPGAMTVGDVTPGPTPPAGQNVTPTKVAIPLNYHRNTEMHLTDKEAREVALNPVSVQLSSAMKVLANDVDGKLLALYKSVYGYAGIAGTTPFAASLAELADAKKVLGDQLCDIDPRNLVMGTAAEANASLLPIVQQAQNRANQSNTLLTGQIGKILGFESFVDQNVPTHTKGAAGTPLLDDNTARAVGIKTLHMDGFTTKPSVGDVFTIAGDTQTYTVTAATDLVGTDSDVSFEPGLAVAIPAADGNEAVTFKASRVVNLAFHRNAFALAVRPLAPADGFTGGHEFRTAVDPISGLALSLEISREYKRTKYEWSILYGVKCVRPEFACRIAG